MFVLCQSALAQSGGESLDDRLDDEAYLKGLADLQLPEVLEHYIQSHPPANDVQAAMYQIALERTHINAAEDAAAQQAAIDRLLAVREELIDTHPGDPRRAIWRTEQAADLLFLAYSVEASGISTLFGVPSAEQRARADRIGRDMNRHMNQAEREIQRALEQIEAAPEFSSDIELQMRRRRLAEDERDRRIPYFRGIGAALYAEFAAVDTDDRRQHWQLALRHLEPLLDALPDALAHKASLYVGLAHVRLGDFDDASRTIDAIISVDALDRSDRFAARMVQVINIEGGRGAADALERLAQMRTQYSDENDLLYRVLIADQTFRMRESQAAMLAGAEAESRRVMAYRAYLELLDEDYGLAPESMESIVFNRLASVAGADAPLDRLPALVSIAVAQRMAADESTRAEAIAMFETSLERNDLNDRDRAAALFGLGRALYEDGRLVAASTRFTQLATRYPTDRRAESSIELAASIADAAYRADPVGAEAQHALREALMVLLDRFPNLPSIDRWQYAAGRLAVDEKSYTRAIQHFNSISVNASQRLDALYMEAATYRAQLRDQQNARSAPGQIRITASALLESVQRARTALEQGIVRVEEGQRKQDLRWYLGSLRVFEANAQLALNDGEAALNAVAGIENEPDLEGSVIARALRARINAYQLLGRSGEASQEIDRFLQTAPEQAGDVLGPLVATIVSEVEELIAINRAEEARQLAEQTLLPHAAHLEQWLRTADIPAGQRRSVSFQLVQALRYGGEYQKALVICDDLLRDQPDALEVLEGKAEALFGLGGESQLGEAMRIYRRIAATVDAGSSSYWRAQLRMLQILEAVDRNVDQIAPRIRRLQQQHPELGGDPWRRQLQALLSRHS